MMNNGTTVRVATSAAAASTAPRLIRPSLRFYHANAKGTGCAVKMTLHPAHDFVDGSIMVSVAKQVTVGNRRAPIPTFPHFDWENAIVVKLEFGDLCKMLQVFRGECESIDEGRGILHRSSCGMTRIVLRHLIGTEGVQGYSFEIYRTKPNGEDVRAHILFSNWEALGLTESIVGVMSFVAFGIPMVIPHDASAGEAACKEGRNVSAA